MSCVPLIVGQLLLDRFKGGQLNERWHGHLNPFGGQHILMGIGSPAREKVALLLLYDGTVYRDRHVRALAELRAVRLQGRAAHYPSQLSGGQQQSVAIACTLVNQPAIILADEPTSNLDSQTGMEIMGVLQALNTQQRITIVLVTHEPDIAHYAQRVIVFKDDLVAEDRPAITARWRQGQGPEPITVAGREDYR